VPSGDGTVVPDAFRYTSHRASKKHGTSLGAAQAAAGAVDPSADPSQSVDPKKGIRVAYQGMPGAYSEAAALTAYPNCEPCPCEQFENAFEATEQWTADRAVLPFENSLGGSIHRNYDLILNHRLHIVGRGVLQGAALPAGASRAGQGGHHARDVAPAGARAVRRLPHRAQRRGR
jgi:hypothetical protein